MGKGLIIIWQVIRTLNRLMYMRLYNNISINLNVVPVASANAHEKLDDELIPLRILPLVN